jgi:hypothetical protein
MVRIALATEPPDIWEWRGRNRNRETIRRQLGSSDAGFGLGRGIGREGVHPAIEHNGIEIHELRDPFGNPIGDPGDRHTPKAVSYENYVDEFLAFDDPTRSSTNVSIVIPRLRRCARSPMPVKLGA